MKKIFDFEETVKYMHSIEVDIDEEQEDEFEDFADTIACDIEENGDSNFSEWLNGFIKKECGGTPEECRAAVEKLRKVEEVVKEWDKVGYAYSNNHMCEIKMIVKGGGVDE